jgi:AraC family transcriptional regulator
MLQRSDTMQTIIPSHRASAVAQQYSGSVTRSYIPEVARLLDHAREALVTNDDVLEDCIRQALVLLRDHGDQPDRQVKPQVARGGLAPWQAKRVDAYIKDNLDSTIRVGDLANLTKLSVSYFSVAFSRSFGMTASAYVSARRIERAQAMMRASSQQLSRIAIECGFCDQAHLSRQFRSVVGTTPRRWRQENHVSREIGSQPAQADRRSRSARAA